MEQACCFTGHRPPKLSFGFDESAEACVALKKRMLQESVRLYEQGIRTYYIGMAQGVDLWAGEIVAGMKRMLEGVRMVAVIPYADQARSWNQEMQSRYAAVMESADEVIQISQQFTKACLHQRNRYMVEHASHMIAVYNGSSGGTKSTLAYATRRGLTIKVIDPDNLQDVK